MKLRQAFSFEGSVLLDMDGADFPGVVDSVLGKLVASGRLPQQSVVMARAALSRLETLPESPIIQPMGSPKQRSPKDKGSPGVPDVIELPASATYSPNRSNDVTRTRLGNVPAKGASPKAKTPPSAGPKSAGGPGAPSSFTLEPALGPPSPQRPAVASTTEDADWFHMLEPDGRKPRAKPRALPPSCCLNVATP